MVVDRNGLDVLARVECLQLLARARVGRLGLSSGALPVVLPVNYALVGDDVIVRSGPGTKLDAALAGAVVAFEVDQVDDTGKTGWSILVQGVASVIDDPAELAIARGLGLRAWAGDGDRFVRIGTERISGRRLT